MASGGSTGVPAPDEGGPANDVDTRLTEKPTDTYRANNLIGHSVMSTTVDDEIGFISDLIIDQHGSVVTVVVGVGGVRGIGNKDVAQCWGSVGLARDADEGI